MALQIKNYKRLVQDLAAAIQGRATALVDFRKGSVLRAFVDAAAGMALWLQSQAVYILSLTRASTSFGVDLDSWMADFSFPRLPAEAASGFVTFNRWTTDATGFVPVGSIAMTEDRTQRFVVLADTNNQAYDAVLGGYTLAVGVSAVTVPVQAQVAGGAANVVAGTVSVIYGALTGIDAVVNNAAMTGGIDAEEDAPYLARFQLYVAAFSKGTEDAIKSAVASLGLGLQCTVTEAVTPGGAPRDGFFFVTVDDGTGAPSAATIASASAAVRRDRAMGIAFGVFAPTIVSADVSMTLTVRSGYDANSVRSIVGNALAKYINSLPLGEGLPYNILAKIAFDASTGVSNSTSILLNGGGSDIPANKICVIKTSSVAVN
jgi:uncharacterized phage protein gp47/JayE